MLTEFKYLSPEALALVRKINAKQEEIDMIDLKMEMII
jgi:hypothetical protein